MIPSCTGWPGCGDPGLLPNSSWGGGGTVAWYDIYREQCGHSIKTKNAHTPQSTGPSRNVPCTGTPVFEGNDGISQKHSVLKQKRLRNDLSVHQEVSGQGNNRIIHSLRLQNECRYAFCYRLCTSILSLKCKNIFACTDMGFSCGGRGGVI